MTALPGDRGWRGSRERERGEVRAQCSLELYASCDRDRGGERGGEAYLE